MIESVVKDGNRIHDRLPRRPVSPVSPINQRRWANFKANRRGYWSLWIFMILFIASLFAEFIANDRPILFPTRANFSRRLG